VKIYRCHHIRTGDYAGSAVCRETFPTASVKSVHAAQLTAASWTMARGYPKQTRFVATVDEDTQTFCPQHKPEVGGLLMPAKRVESG
jgi:hypothetical protein